MKGNTRQRAIAIGDAIAFSGLLPAALAATLVLAAARGMQVSLPWGPAFLAAAGTLVVYNVDRLSDLTADRDSAPRRSAWIERHRTALRVITTIAGLASAALALRATRGIWLLCGAILAVGLLHRQLKRASAWKPVYVAAAWVAVTIGMAALAGEAPRPTAVAWIAAVYTGAVGANLVGSNTRGWGLRDPARNLWIARGLALFGVVAGVAAGPPLRALAWVPATELAILLCFRHGERYRLVALDGALLIGALLALATLAGSA